MCRAFIHFLLLWLCVLGVWGNFQVDDSDADLTTLQLLRKYGYRARPYTVTTSDGYRLTLHRMFQKGGYDRLLLPVLVVHGLLGSSSDFIIAGPEHGLGYQLANDGFDVWLANTRGNRYSREHLHLSPADSEFWEFSWHEKAIYDLPAMIDFILNETSTTQLYYIGYSQGSTEYYVLTSFRPEYNHKIRYAHTLAPAVTLHDIRSPVVRAAVDNSASLISLGRRLNVVELLPWSAQQNTLIRMSCAVNTPGSQCETFAANLFGPHPESYDKQILQLLFAHCPSGASRKELEHFNQVVYSGIFRPFERDGIECIHQPYNLSASSAPVSIFYGLNDWIVHPKNMNRLAVLLPNLRELAAVGGKKFNHVDFIIGKRVRTAVYHKILQNLRNDSRAYQRLPVMS